MKHEPVLPNIHDPDPGLTHEWRHVWYPSRLEYFAGLAMQGLCARPDEDFQSWPQLATCAVTVAGCLIAELEKHHG